MTLVSSPIRAEFLPYALPSIGEEEIAEVVDSLRSGWVTTGPKVKRFEQEFQAYAGTRNALAVNSCTAGLHIALTALGIGEGDEVIVPTMTFCATANVAVQLGARPVLVDVDGESLISPEAIEAAITPRTKAMMPVHFAGQSVDLDAIYALSEQYRIPIVEDAAHAVGTVYRGRKIGSDTLLGQSIGVPRIAAYSFYATKNMTTGEGGMIATPDDDLAERMRLLTLHGMSRDAWARYTSTGSWYYEVVAAGYKDNMTDIQASLGIHQLRRLDGFIRVRQAYAKRYDEGFADLPEILTPVARDGLGHIYHLYVIRLVPERLTIDRAAFIDALRAENIGTSVHFIPVHLHPFYREQYGYRRGDFPNAEAIYDTIISLPLYPGMTEQDIEDVISAVRKIVSRHRA